MTEGITLEKSFPQDVENLVEKKTPKGEKQKKYCRIRNYRKKSQGMTKHSGILKKMWKLVDNMSQRRHKI